MGPDEARAPLVTEVRIQPTREPPILAFASITLWGLLVVHDLRILLRRDGSRVVLMPRMHSPEGGWTTVAHPVNEETRLTIEAAVLEAYALARRPVLPGPAATSGVAAEDSSLASLPSTGDRRTA
jgi:DNA-binding cell septation regulator SpoVG